MARNEADREDVMRLGIEGTWTDLLCDPRREIACSLVIDGKALDGTFTGSKPGDTRDGKTEQVEPEGAFVPLALLRWP